MPITDVDLKRTQRLHDAGVPHLGVVAYTEAELVLCVGDIGRAERSGTGWQRGSSKDYEGQCRGSDESPDHDAFSMHFLQWVLDIAHDPPTAC